ncbi:hypothetical protein PMI02_03878 [Novosphingobium sp. AP12]|nr:hypothetical protein PMI02_03878 [Novosphingobium sp. AP12]
MSVVWTLFMAGRDTDEDKFAVWLGEMARLLSDLPHDIVGHAIDEAMLLLFQAASAVCVTRLSPPDFALAAYDGATRVARARLVEVMGAKQARN